MIGHEGTNAPAIDPDISAYHTISPLAILAVVLGIASPLAWLHPMLWIIPACGAGVAALAIRSITASDGALTGRKAAMLGLALSMFFLAASATNYFSFAHRLGQESQPVALTWFEYLQNGEPHKAHQLLQPALRRLDFNDDLWGFYRRTPESREELKRFASEPGIAAILTLGHRGKIAYYTTEGVARESDRDSLSQIYSVTYDDKGVKKTFFVRVGLERRASDHGAEWTIVGYTGGARPNDPPMN